MTTPKSAGARFREEVLDDCGFSPGENLLLHHAVAVSDALDRISEELAGASLVTTGSTGQRVAEPLLDAQRRHAARLTALIEAIRLPARDEEYGRSSASRSAQRAAQARWAKQKRGA